MSWQTSYPLCFDALPGVPCIIEEEQGTIYYPEYRECAHSALLFPGFNLLPNALLAAIYGLALAWCFFGVAIISDIFMSSIEQITSAEKTVTRKDSCGNERTIQVLVWNPTVANLTLMALGSSAPEIMLAVVETMITLGSAAYNLLVISAVCIMSVPEGEFKSVTDFGVFAFTAIFSLWAYLWMLIVYVIWTPDQITILEAVLTLAYLPIMVVCAYKINTMGKSGESELSLGEGKDGEEGYQRIVGANVDLPDGNQMHIKGEDIAHNVNRMVDHDFLCAPSLDQRRTLSLPTTELIKCIEGLDTDDVSAMKQAAWDIAQQAQTPMTPIQYKINARKAMTGKAYVGSKDLYPTNSIVPESAGAATHDIVATVSFGASAYTGTQSNGHIRLQVTCAREAHSESSIVRVAYSTRDGQPIGVEKDVATDKTSGELVFGPEEETKYIYAYPFQDDDMEYEIGEGFIVDLKPVEGCDIRIQRASASVQIEGSTFPGRLMFLESSLEVNYTGQWAYIPVVRKHGCIGDVSVDYTTMDGAAKSGVHYETTSGTLTFTTGEKQKDIQVRIKEGEVDKSFQVVLSNPQNTTLNAKRSTCDVYLVHDAKFGLVMRMVQSIIRRKNDAVSARSTWLDQFKEAIIPGGEIAVESGEAQLEMSDYILHYVSFTWKVLFATVPPPEFMSGGPCFVISVLYIGGITYIVGEFAALFGCAVGLPDAVTAYSFVALGTSLPDTFASRQAATEASDADAAIGNVTGSNCVNVFLGLGLPWLIASMYYAAKGQEYTTPRGALAFSVTVFMCCSLICLMMLVAKKFMGGELGGSGFTRTGFACILIGLWLLYLIISGMQAVGTIQGF